MSKYIFNNDFVIRTALRSFENGVDLIGLKKFFHEPFHREALFLASKSLFNKLKKWEQNEVFEKKEFKSFTISLYKYYTRIHTRPMPFGLFAGCSVASWSKESLIDFNGNYTYENINRLTRIDYSIMYRITRELQKNIFIKKQLIYKVNSSLYDISNSYRYVEFSEDKNNRHHNFSSIEKDYYLNKILNIAKDGKSYSTLVKSILSDSFDSNEIEQYLDQLIDNQVLVSNLEISLTGEDYLSKTIQILKSISQNDDSVLRIILILEKIIVKLNEIDNNVINKINSYEVVENEIRKIIKLDENDKIFHVEMFRKSNSPIKLSNKISDDLKNCIIFLNHINSNSPNRKLHDFIDQFYRLFESKEIPLPKALDEEIGVGYPSHKKKRIFNPILKDIHSNNNFTRQNSLNLNGFEVKLLNILIDAIKTKKMEVNIADKVNLPSKLDLISFPDTMSCTFSLINNKNCDIWLQSCGGSSAVNILGRFTNGSSEIKELVDNISKYEAKINPNSVIAEIVHTPKSRIGNVTSHPELRQFEIPYLVNSSVKNSNVININDILVSVNPISKHVYLKWKKNGRLILPRLSNSHNFSHESLSTYEFLCDMQTQNLKHGLFFNWGNLTTQFKFLPSIKWNNILLNPSSWRLNKYDFNTLLKLNPDLDGWLKKWNIPNEIVIVRGDQKLYINFKNSLSREVFFETIKKSNTLIIEEFLFSNKNNIKNKKNKHYANECIVALKKNEINVDLNTFNKNNLNNTNTTFPIGSEWLYFKIYVGSYISDNILLDVISPFISECFKKDLIKSWFFIRYSDPENHIRFRIKLKSNGGLNDAINLMGLLTKELVTNGEIKKILIDSYEREVEKYGKETINLSEEIFYLDSSNFIKFLSAFKNNIEIEDYRWLFCIKSIDNILNVFSFDIDQKKKNLEIMKASFEMEFSAKKSTRISLQKKFRENRSQIIQVLEKVKSGEDTKLNMLINLVEDKNRKSKIISDYMKCLKIEDIQSFVINHIHVMVNRIFKSEHRLCELVIYTLMYNHYNSEVAKIKSISKNK